MNKVKSLILFLLLGSAQITEAQKHYDLSLPIGPNASVSKLDTAIYFYLQLINPSLWGNPNGLYPKLRKLPPTKSTNYIYLDSSERRVSKDGKRVDELIRVPNYKYHLPDHGNLQVYLMCGIAGNREEDSMHLLKDFNPPMSGHYAQLIFIDTATRVSSILTLYKFVAWDGFTYSRNFYINKNYDIYLVDFLTGENGEKEFIYRHLVQIEASNKIIIKRLPLK